MMIVHSELLTPASWVMTVTAIRLPRSAAVTTYRGASRAPSMRAHEPCVSPVHRIQR